MKYIKQSVVCAICNLSIASAFAPTLASTSYCRSAATNDSKCYSIITGPEGKPASSKEEDIALTLKIIMAHDSRSVTVTAEQYVSQISEVSSMDEPEIVDVSVPYDAAALLAYSASDKVLDFDSFKANYIAESINLVKSNRPVDVSIPYDAAAKLAYEKSDKSLLYSDFKVKYETDAVADVISKRPVDVSIPYDAASKLAYEKSDKSLPYSDFKVKYETDAVADVISKKL